MDAGPKKARWIGGRSAHRQRSHDEAHAGAAEVPLPPILQHELVPQGEPAIVATQRDLDAHLETLRAAGSFAYDTEFIGEQSYHARLCVIQTATSRAVTIIDPIAPRLDLRGLWELIADSGVETIVHAGEQDLEPIVRHISRAPANVFDTQIVAAFAGYGYPTGMGRLVRDLLAADPGHGLTFSQWDRRPLTHVQVMYAANDVRYLPLLRDTLAEKAQAAGNVQWAREECGSLCESRRYLVDPANQAQRIRGVENLEPQQLAVFESLIAWREHAAQAQDVPPRTLLRDGILLAMAHNPPLEVADLDRIEGLPRPVENRWGQAIVQATRAGLDAPLRDGLKHVEFDRWKHRKKVDRLHVVAAEKCKARGVDPAIATSKREIGQYVRMLDGGSSREAAGGRLLRGWRRELFGDLFA